MLPWKLITCPYCFKKFRAGEVMFRCKEFLCAKEQDKTYDDHRSEQKVDKGHVFGASTSSRFFKMLSAPRESTCDKCGEKSNTRLCPKCHFTLSDDIGLVDDYSIAVIGGSGTGKSHYITTLVDRLDKEIGAQFGFCFCMVGDDTRKRFPEDYGTPLLQKKEVLQPNRSALHDSKIKSPMIFRLTFHKQKLFARRSVAVNLSFFDCAGEDMKSLDTMSSEARYICSAAGIIFLLDPLQIDSVRHKLSGSILPARDTEAEPTYLAERLRELFERQGLVRPTQKIKTPIAFVLSKVDMLLPIIDRGSALHKTGEHFGRFNLVDADSVNTEICNYLDSWTGLGLSNRIDTGFARHRFFGVSSLGHAPNKDGHLESVSPTRIEDPFLWVLYTLGLIKGKR